MQVNTLLIVFVLVVLVLALLPTWPYSVGFGYFPSGILGLILVVVLILALVGRL